MNMILNTEKITFDHIIGNCPILEEQKELAKKAAKVDIPVMITGETGTGKELFAKAIHQASKRSSALYLAENCGAVPQNLMESVFFGTEKGAFTQAVSQEGLFELANGGTLLLDELNSMPIALQSKLLRVLQEKNIRRIGGLKSIPIDVRVITALNEEPEVLMQEGRLRPDLFYRLNVIRIHVPALREHKEDIPLYLDYFLEKANKKYGKNICRFDKKTVKWLMAKDFPGNIRQLENLVESAVALSGRKNVLTSADFY